MKKITMNRFGQVNAEVVRQLVAIAGSRNVITEQEQLQNYVKDESPMAEPHLPAVVVKPENAAAVAKILAVANQNLIPVTPRGAGTGLSGGCIPMFGGIVISTEKMDQVLEIDRENFVAVVEPGLPLKSLYEALDKVGLYYPLYPGETSASVGGNIATNAGGMNAVKYGVTRHNVLGLEAALPNGEIIHTGGKFVKCSTGYDLTQLIIGSEGTLALVTKIILKLTTKPARREVLFAPFKDLQNAIDAVPDILALKAVPNGIEFIEKGIIDIIEKETGNEMPYHDYDAFLMIIMDGETENEIMEYFAKVEEICRKHGAVETMVPGSERAKRRLLESREKFYHAIKKYAPMELIDVVVPRSKIAEFVGRVKEISKKWGLTVIIYGHAGDGNVHLHPIKVNMSEEEWLSALKNFMQEIYGVGVGMGGTISGEHGIGIEKKEYFLRETQPAFLNVMKGIKKAFDPNGILNPGKIFD